MISIKLTTIRGSLPSVTRTTIYEHPIPNTALEILIIRSIFGIHHHRFLHQRLEPLKIHPNARTLSILRTHLCHIIGAGGEASDGIGGFGHGDGASPIAVSRGFVSHFPFGGCTCVPAEGGRGVGHVAYLEVGGGGILLHAEVVEPDALDYVVRVV